MESIYTILIFICAFIVGAIPFSIIIGKTFYNIDVRKVGSGNPGATNTFRALGKKAGIAVLLLDISKGIIAVMISRLITPGYDLTRMDVNAITGGLAVLGHIYSPFLGFKGGKGVATATGVVFFLNPLIGVVCFVIFLGIFMVSKYVSLSSILTAFLLPFVYYIIEGSNDRAFIVFSIILALMIIFKHKENILRLIHGEENKMHLKLR